MEDLDSSIESSTTESILAEGFSLITSKGVDGLFSRLPFSLKPNVSPSGLAIEIQGTLEGYFIDSSLSSLKEDCYEDFELLLLMWGIILTFDFLIMSFIIISFE